MKTKLFPIIIIMLVAGSLGMVALFKKDMPQPPAHANAKGNTHELITYKSPTCGCCGNWVTYMKMKGYKIETVNTDDMDNIKEQYEIPESLYSCHTTIVNGGQYFIEGHIPEEATLQLMETEPDIAGIGMPGMPAASPGMPGEKIAPFDISQVHNDSTISSFMSI